MRKWLAIAVGVITLDQFSKWAILALLPLYTSIELTGFFNLVHVRNEGAAFSLLADQPGWQRFFFIILGLLVSAAILVWLRRPMPRLQAVALSLILGGAVGNIIDRLVHGNVVDFLDFHAAGWHWPAFNIADSALTVGALLILWLSFRAPPHPDSSAST